jgi:protein SCO1/2
VAALVVLGLCLAPPPAAAQDADRIEPPPADLEGMKVTEHLDEKIPLDLEFTDHNGKPVKLSDYLDGQRPVILTLNYYRCPMLCGLMLNAAVDGLKEIEWTIGEEFGMLTVSFDPIETYDLANLKRQNYLRDYGRPEAGGGWDFLVGKSESIDKLLDATGFPIRWNEGRSEWIHPACIMILTPDGRLSRYLYGVYYDPKTLRLSLVEASQGKIGSTVDQILLWCYHFDPQEGSYTLAAMRLARAGGILTLIVLGSFLTFLWRREHRRRPAPAAAAEAKENTDSSQS